MAKAMSLAYRQFLEDIRNGKTFCNYLDEGELENEYSHQEIREGMRIFSEQVKRFLHDNYPDTWIVYCDWCVHVMTIDEAQKRHVRIFAKYLA